LAWRVTGNDVQTDDIIDSIGVDQNPIRVSAYGIVLYQVPAAAANQADTEVVIAVGNGAIAAEKTPPNPIVVAVDEAVAATGRRRRVICVPDGDDVFYEAVGHGVRQ
jgi:co-chaperonin GroES (HSP10)